MIELAVPALVFFLMFIIGASIDRTDFTELKEQRRDIIAVTLGQILLLPISAFLLIQIMQPPASVAGGMLLVSLCPAGAVSNIYSFLAKANVALSVTLTALNGFVGVALLPIFVIILFPSILEIDLELKDLVLRQSLQLVMLLISPLVFGILLRYFKPRLMLKMLPVLEKMGGVGLLALLLAIFIQYQKNIVEQLSALVLLAVLFTFVSLFIAFCLSRFLKLQQKDEAAVVIEFPVRNLALTAVIAVNIFHNSDYLLFAAVFFVIQTPVMLAITAWYRSQLVNGGLPKAIPGINGNTHQQSDPVQ